jgi:hypothetical protein
MNQREYEKIVELSKLKYAQMIEKAKADFLGKRAGRLENIQAMRDGETESIQAQG